MERGKKLRMVVTKVMRIVVMKVVMKIVMMVLLVMKASINNLDVEAETPQ